MRIQRVRVRKYRCLEDLAIEVPDYMALVGANGSGKSSLLYALNWFFNGTVPAADDVHSTTVTEAAGITHDEIDVEVTFGDLTEEDRAILGQYGRGTTASFRRTWNAIDQKEKLLGNSRQGPGFAAIRAPGVRAEEARTFYNAAREHCDGLPAATTVVSIKAALDAWEADPQNTSQLEEVESSDATHMFGITGEHTLAKRVRFVLIPASADLAGQVGTTNRGSALQELIGSLMSGAVTTARVKWETEHASEIASLETAIKTAVDGATKVHTERVNALLSDLVPKATVEFTSEPPAWSLKGDGSVLTDVTIDGERKDVSRQGHGVQRAVMIAMLQARVPDEALVKAQLEQSGLEEEQVNEQLASELAKLPALIVAIEEPEIYQHPVRARHFARVLALLAKRADTQVMLATHSPYFVLPEQFASLRRFTLDRGSTSVASSSIAEIATAASKPEDAVLRTVEKELPRTFSEGFFADAVVFVEGDTDRVVIETIAERLEKPLDALGIAVLAIGGQGSIRIPREILNSLGIKVYVVADTDSLGATRGNADDPAKQQQADQTHEASTNALLEWLPPSTTLIGTDPFTYRCETTVTDAWTLFHDDLETELEGWPSFAAKMHELNSSIRSKNLAAYHNASSDALLTDMPESLKVLVEAIANFG